MELKLNVTSAII